jgi:CheY-like chemotaxis protein
LALRPAPAARRLGDLCPTGYLYLSGRPPCRSSFGGTALSQTTNRSTTTILVVDDERVSRRLALRILSEQGYRLLEADGAAEALEVLSNVEGCVDLVVLDVVMPGCNGVELGRRLQQLWPGQRIMYMSAHPAEAVRQGVPGTGVPYLHKPYTHDEALAKVQEALQAA